MPFDNAVALEQMIAAYDELLSRRSDTYSKADNQAAQEKLEAEGKRVPKIVTLGGDHSIALAALKALNKYHGQLAVLHFDARKSHAIFSWDFVKTLFNVQVSLLEI